MGREEKKEGERRDTHRFTMHGFTPLLPATVGLGQAGGRSLRLLTIRVSLKGGTVPSSHWLLPRDVSRKLGLEQKQDLISGTLIWDIGVQVAA